MPARRNRWLRVVLLSAALLIVAIPQISRAFRDNDQAAFINGAIHLNRGEAKPWRAGFYNFDKQWLTYDLTAVALRFLPNADPVLAGNLLEELLLVGALLYLFASTGIELWLAIPLVFTPALMLYLPFLASASVSLAFLIVAICSLRSRRNSLAIAFVFLAAAARGDVILAVPAILLATTPRRSVASLFRSHRNWLVALAAVLPVFMGKVMDVHREGNLLELYFDPLIIGGFLVFCLGVEFIVVAGAMLGTLAHAIFKSRQGRAFYALSIAALLLPFLFYVAQLHSPRYFFLAIAAFLAFGVSARARLLRPSIPLLALGIVPWLVGLKLPDLRHPALTLENATVFPTADGAFPMGAYFGFLANAVRSGMVIDHNEALSIAAQTVTYRTCNGSVPILETPMSNYVELAATIERQPTVVNAHPCTFAYADLRSLIRRDIPNPGFNYALQIFSTRSDLGRPIVRLDFNQPPTQLTRQVELLSNRAQSRDLKYFGPVQEARTIITSPGLTYYLPTGDLYPGQASRLTIPSNTAYAQTVFPAYMRR